jgi:hypothetical protein
MNLKVYCLTNRQSDKQRAQRTNPKWYAGVYWDEFGMVLFKFISNLSLSPWNAEKMYCNDGVKGPNVEEMFVNVLSSYYMLLINIYMLQQNYGEEWEKHSLPLVTIRNTLGDCGCFVVRCMHMPADLPLLGSCQQEWVQETHFSDVKNEAQNPRGMPKVKDMIVGAFFCLLYVPPPVCISHYITMSQCIQHKQC